MPTVVIHDADGLVRMIVYADTEAELSDPAFNPKGCAQWRVPEVHAEKEPAEILTLSKTEGPRELKAQPAVDTSKDPKYWSADKVDIAEPSQAVTK